MARELEGPASDNLSRETVRALLDATNHGWLPVPSIIEKRPARYQQMLEVTTSLVRDLN